MSRHAYSAPMTDEDVCIFAHGYRDCPIPPGLPDLAALPENCPRPFYRGLVWGMSADSDKRDADLMLLLGNELRRSLLIPRRIILAWRAWQGMPVAATTDGG